jgi:hypothetical protein
MGVKISLGAGKKVHQSGPRLRRFGRNTSEGRRALTHFSDGLAEAGATYWLTYGALLGLVREGRLLAHDRDLDFAACDGPATAKIETALLKRQFTLVFEGWVGDRLGIQKFQRGHVRIDLFFLYQRDGVWVEEYPIDGFSYYSGTHPILPIESRRLGGVEVPIPVDTAAYLRHLYGRSWRKMRNDWSWKFSPPNTTAHLHWRSWWSWGWGALQYRLKQRRLKGAPE